MKKKIVIIIISIALILLTSIGVYIAYDNGYIFNKGEKEQFNYMPLTYEICDDNNCIYLLGSIHIGDTRVNKFNKKLIDLYNKSKYLAVELDTKNININVSEFISSEPLNLEEKLKTKLNDFFSKHGILSFEQLEYFKLGYIADYAALLPAMEIGLVSSGVDEYFLTKAHNENKEIIELETYEEQISFILDYSDEFYIKDLKNIIEKYDEGKEEIKNLYEEYLKANKPKLEELINEEESIETEEERIYQSKMTTERNIKMATKVEEFLSNDQDVFMVVGLAHVLGTDGIINELQNKNYKINIIK